MTFAQKNAWILHNNCPKNIFPDIFFWGGEGEGGGTCPLPSPCLSYAYVAGLTWGARASTPCTLALCMFLGGWVLCFHVVLQYCSIRHSLHVLSHAKLFDSKLQLSKCGRSRFQSCMSTTGGSTVTATQTMTTNFNCWNLSNDVK